MFFKKLNKSLLFIVLLSSFSFQKSVNTDNEEHQDIWYRTVPNPDNPAESILYKIDMSVGYAFCDGQYIYLVMRRLDEDKRIVIAFENYNYWYNEGSYWTAPEKLEENKMIEDEINSLEEYLQKSDSNNKIENIK